MRGKVPSAIGHTGTTGESTCLLDGKRLIWPNKRIEEKIEKSNISYY
jgi:hypothetical protein